MRRELRLRPDGQWDLYIGRAFDPCAWGSLATVLHCVLVSENVELETENHGLKLEVAKLRHQLAAATSQFAGLR